MLVVDLHALHTVHLLNLIDDVFLHLDGTLDGQDVGRGDGTVGEGHACADVVVLLYENLLGQGHEIAFLVSGLGTDDNLAVASLDLAHLDLSVDLGDDGGIGGVAGLEELCDAGQTSGDITGFTDSAGNFHDNISGLDLLSVLYHQVGAYGEVVLLHLGAVIHDVDSGVLGFVPGLDDDFLLVEGVFVGGLLPEGDALD